MNKKLLLLFIIVLLISGCTTSEIPRKELTEMNCDELANEIERRPYIMIDNNELYVRNVIGIMQLKDCSLE